MAILPIDSGRYGTKEMLAIFDERARMEYQLAVEGAVAAAQGELGMIPGSAGAEILAAAGSGTITPARIKYFEKKSDHDTAALVEALNEKCGAGSRPWIHYGLTSNDLVDTSNSMQMRDALRVIRQKIMDLAQVLSEAAADYSDLPAVGRTHGQHASIIAFGLKFANWAAEIVAHMERIRGLEKRVLVCKTLGVVGTGSLMGADAVKVQDMVAKILGLHPVEVATQVVARERYAEYVFETALLGSTLEKIAVEVRNLQRTEIGEVSEFFKKGQMGSSAVPVKRNPTKSERVSSLARLLKSQVAVALDNVPLWHERDLSNSANERFIIPVASIILDEMLHCMIGVVRGLRVDEERVAANLGITKGQIFAEFVLEALIKKGVARFEAYRDVQRVAFKANEEGMEFSEAVKEDRSISSRLSAEEIDGIFKPESHLGASRIIISNVKKTVRTMISKENRTRPKIID